MESEDKEADLGWSELHADVLDGVSDYYGEQSWEWKKGLYEENGKASKFREHNVINMTASGEKSWGRGIELHLSDISHILMNH